MKSALDSTQCSGKMGHAIKNHWMSKTNWVCLCIVWKRKKRHHTIVICVQIRRRISHIAKKWEFSRLQNDSVTAMKHLISYNRTEVNEKFSETKSVRCSNFISTRFTPSYMHIISSIQIIRCDFGIFHEAGMFGWRIKKTTKLEQAMIVHTTMDIRCFWLEKKDHTFFPPFRKFFSTIHWL